ncbi:MAG: hypothetical protein AAB542_02820 [Patescibacteria group bacterium]
MNKREPHQGTTDKGKREPSGFPHYPRLFSAPHIPRILGGVGKTLLWLILIFSILTSLTATSPAAGEQMDRILKQIGLMTTLTAKNSAILGASDTLATENTAVEHRYEYWQNVIRNHPDYRDGHYMLALLAFQRGNMDETRIHLNKVKILDPNYPGIALLETLLSGE